MARYLSFLWHKAREYGIHWTVAGAVVAATGAPPEHWVAEFLQDLRLPPGATPPWFEYVDYRLAALAVGLSIMTGAVGSQMYERFWRAKELPPKTKAEEPWTDRPSIAVLAFANMSRDPDQEYFSDGMADDIITELSRDRSLFVIARNSSFSYRGRSVDVKQVGRELGVQYLVEGSARREASRVQVNANLIDTRTGASVWSDKYHRALEDIFVVQDEIAESVVASIRTAIIPHEQRRVRRKVPGSLKSWEAYQRGLWYLSRNTTMGNEQARVFFRQGANIDPGLALAYVGLAATYISDAMFHGTRSLVEVSVLIEAEARRAIESDPNDADAHATLGWSFFFGGNLTGGLDCAEHALALNQNCPGGHFLKGSILIYTGNPDKGRAAVEISRRLSPVDPSLPYTLGLIAASYYLESDYSAAIDAAQRGLDNHPAYSAVRRWLVASLGQLGRQEEAAVALHDWLAAAPSVFDVTIRHRPPWVSPNDQEHLLNGLRKAGWQADERP